MNRALPLVVVVDDDAALRAILERMIRQQGFDVVTFPDGGPALATLRAALLLVGGSMLYVTLGPVHIHSTTPGKMTGLLLTGLVAARLAIAAFDLGGLERPLTPIVVDALVVLLGFTVLYGVTIGWINLRRLRKRGAERVLTDVRFG